MQVLSNKVSFTRALHAFAVRDGILSLWTGISASILRQTTYSTTRFALYDFFSRKLSTFSIRPQKSLSRGSIIASAGLAGGIAGLVGNPAEVVLVRMCADGAKHPAEHFAYKNAIDALVRVGREDGLGAYFRGLGPNIVRSVLMNVSQIATYTEAKKQLINRFQLKDNVGTHIGASFVAGTVATTVCAPADVLKSRFQNARIENNSARTSILRYVLDTVAKEGPQFLMKGWMPAWLRLAPNTVLTFVFMERLKSLFAK